MPISSNSVAIVGAGPAGLMAAQVLSKAGIEVQVFDAMPSVGRKFLLAGRGGLNLTHSEPGDVFVSRFAQAQGRIEPLIRRFGPDALRRWAQDLGIETFVGSSGRVFPKEMKAAPLLRAWLHRLRHPTQGGAPVSFHMRHRCIGWRYREGGLGMALRFQTPEGERAVTTDRVIFALGGASWPRLGSDGSWISWITEQGVAVAPLQPANCGFHISPTHARQAEAHRVEPDGWSIYFRQRFAGQPLKSVAIAVLDGTGGIRFSRRGEFVVTEAGIEGSLIYAASALLRDDIAQEGVAQLLLDLLPERTVEEVRAALRAPRNGQTLANHLRRRLRLEGLKAALLRELLPPDSMRDPDQLAGFIKALPLTLCATRPIEEAISSAGGILFDELDEYLQLKRFPGAFCAGEMLDWEAPTGGYLLTACMASGVRAAEGILEQARS